MKRILAGRNTERERHGSCLLYKFPLSAIRDSEIMLIPPRIFLLASRP